MRPWVQPSSQPQTKFYKESGDWGTEAGGSELSLAYTVRPCLRERNKNKRGEMNLKNVLSRARKVAQRLGAGATPAEDKQAGGLQPPTSSSRGL